MDQQRQFMFSGNRKRNRVVWISVFSRTGTAATIDKKQPIQIFSISEKEIESIHETGLQLPDHLHPVVRGIASPAIFHADPLFNSYFLFAGFHISPGLSTLRLLRGQKDFRCQHRQGRYLGWHRYDCCLPLKLNRIHSLHLSIKKVQNLSSFLVELKIKLLQLIITLISIVLQTTLPFLAKFKQ